MTNDAVPKEGHRRIDTAAACLDAVIVRQQSPWYNGLDLTRSDVGRNYPYSLWLAFIIDQCKLHKTASYYLPVP